MENSNAPYPIEENRLKELSISKPGGKLKQKKISSRSKRKAGIMKNEIFFFHPQLDLESRLCRTTDEWRLNEKSSYFDFASNYTQRNSLSMFDNESKEELPKEMNEIKNGKSKAIRKNANHFSFNFAWKFFFFSHIERQDFLSIVSKMLLASKTENYFSHSFFSISSDAPVLSHYLKPIPWEIHYQKAGSMCSALSWAFPERSSRARW